MTPAPLQVCFVIQKLHGLSGGAERVVLQTATAMAARGMQVRIVIYDTASGPPKFDTGGLEIRNLLPSVLQSRAGAAPQGGQTPAALRKFPQSGVMGHLKWAVTHGLFARRLRAELRRRKPDVVIAFLPPAITAAVRATRASGVPVIASTHNVPEQDFGATSPRWDQNPVYRRRARAALTHATRITVLQDSFCDWFTPDEQTRITVLANPVSRLSPAPAPATAPAREKLVLAMGRLTAVKRFDLLVAAWARLRSQFPDWRVEIYGAGPEQDALTAQITAAGLEAVVRLCGTTPDPGPLYDRAGLLCHPATFEGFGLSVAEAMAHGTPAIGFADCTGINALITHGVDGVLLEAGEADRADVLAAGLSGVLGAPGKLHAMGTQATAITQAYHPDKIAHQWESLIRSSARQDSQPRR